MAGNDLPSFFFTRLIWWETVLNPKAVSRNGAQGIAQILPVTASERGLADPSTSRRRWRTRCNAATRGGMVGLM
ncbi:transglycosylase SLT domain-containing protein [Aureimonas sp. Leaf454]|uniref:transglycosylase SLT domain-containing protein n=1 Tax=Aureimonas sp. Leaf454 TaxID=1736381 RepID=UPI000B15CB9F|nr:transglycosylase SLT domain-containing protein [Aureimonas sp. Leaf454]